MEKRVICANLVFVVNSKKFAMNNNYMFCITNDWKSMYARDFRLVNFKTSRFTSEREISAKVRYF